MITRLEISNFKIHRATVIDMAPLTIFTGINGMGKSSVTQALLMLRESVINDHYPRVLKLRGDSFEIEEQSPALVNWYAVEQPDRLTISVSFEGAEKPYSFSYMYPLKAVTELDRAPEASVYPPEILRGYSLFNDGFQYLSAYRFGPVSVYGGDSWALSHRQVSLVKGQGEYGVAILERYGREDVALRQTVISDARGSGDASLLTQTSLWLSRISPRVSLSIDVDGNKYSLRYNYPGPGGRLKSVKPANTGYGISYVLSAVVALLITPPDGVVIIENPEAHIHPSAQSALMELVARVVAGGVQVIIETHSDHIVFGALVNIKKGLMRRDQTAIWHFDTNPESGMLDVQPVTIGPDSRIKNPPPHFVEQMNLDLDVLFDEEEAYGG